jgi:hypothetical protein
MDFDCESILTLCFFHHFSIYSELTLVQFNVMLTLLKNTIKVQNVLIIKFLL